MQYMCAWQVLSTIYSVCVCVFRKSSMRMLENVDLLFTRRKMYKMHNLSPIHIRTWEMGKCSCVCDNNNVIWCKFILFIKFMRKLLHSTRSPFGVRTVIFHYFDYINSLLSVLFEFWKFNAKRVCVCVSQRTFNICVHLNYICANSIELSRDTCNSFWFTCIWKR